MNAVDAQLISFSFPTETIPDDDLAGLSSLAIAPAISEVTSVSITLSHEWAGDLKIELVSPDGSEILVINRPGVSGSDPMGSSAVFGTFQPNSDSTFSLVPTTYRFAATGTSLISEGLTLLDTNPALPNNTTYAAATWTSGPFSAGTWTLRVADAADLCTGEVTSADITFSAVPEPASTALLTGLILTLVAGGRRMSQSKRRKLPILFLGRVEPHGP